MSVATLELMGMIERHEEYRRFCYKDTLGYTTIGIGRNCETKGISRKEALFLLENDINEVHQQLLISLPFYENLNNERKNVLISMGFNIGVSGLLKFNRMLNAIEISDYRTASKEMLNSKWAKQVGNRAIELSQMMYSVLE